MRPVSDALFSTPAPFLRAHRRKTLAIFSLISWEMFRLAAFLRSTNSDVYRQHPPAKERRVEASSFLAYSINKEEVSLTQLFFRRERTPETVFSDHYNYPLLEQEQRLSPYPTYTHNMNSVPLHRYNQQSVTFYIRVAIEPCVGWT